MPHVAILNFHLPEPMHSLIVLLPGQGLYNELMYPMTALLATKPYMAPHTALKIPPLAMKQDT